MARASTIEQLSPNTDAINLSRALSRLEQKILSTNPDTRLQCSSYERTKTAANVEHARTLLLRLEHQTSSINIQSREQAAQADFSNQRVLIKRLNDRLHEFDQLDRGGCASSSSDEDLFRLSAPTRTQITASAATESVALALDRRKHPLQSSEQSSTLRNRHIPLSHAAPSTTTGHSVFPSSASATHSSKTTTLLEAAATEQSTLTSLLIAQASALKKSSLAFSAELDVDKIAVSTTESTLGNNLDGLEAATRRMGLLNNMSEGMWWWGRMLLYIGIGTLWVVALAVVFVMPKLRF